MNKRNLLLLLLLALTLFQSCNEWKIARDLRGFCKNEVVIPPDLQKISDRSQSEIGNLPQTPLLIFYHDSLACSSCQINHLPDYIGVYELADSLGTFEVLTIFSPRLDEYDEVVRLLMVQNFPYPVYVDFSGSFRRGNSFIPSDSRFHNFLTDSRGRPVLVGNPVAGDTMWDLFMKTLDTAE